jgi:hypothetical protein
MVKEYGFEVDGYVLFWGSIMKVTWRDCGKLKRISE